MFTLDRDDSEDRRFLSERFVNKRYSEEKAEQQQLLDDAVVVVRPRIEDNKAYVSPDLFSKLQETALRTLGDDCVWAQEARRLLMLTDDEYETAKRNGLEVVVEW